MILCFIYFGEGNVSFDQLATINGFDKTGAAEAWTDRLFGPKGASPVNI